MSVAARLLRDSAETLRQKGWCRLFIIGPDGKHCALGAMLMQGEKSPQDYGRYGGSALAALREQIGGKSITCWNDAPGRTAEEVIAAFEAAAVKCESAHVRSEAGQSDSREVQEC